MCLVSRFMDRPELLWEAGLGLSAAVLSVAGVVIGF
jgi:hypothetical protein